MPNKTTSCATVDWVTLQVVRCRGKALSNEKRSYIQKFNTFIRFCYFCLASGWELLRGPPLLRRRPCHIARVAIICCAFDFCVYFCLIFEFSIVFETSNSQQIWFRSRISELGRWKTGVSSPTGRPICCGTPWSRRLTISKEWRLWWRTSWCTRWGGVMSRKSFRMVDHALRRLCVWRVRIAKMAFYYSNTSMMYDKKNCTLQSITTRGFWIVLRCFYFWIVDKNSLVGLVRLSIVIVRIPTPQSNNLNQKTCISVAIHVKCSWY